jgi:hypothetical protein
MDNEYNPLTTGQIIAIVTCSIILAIFQIAALWKVFTKAGQPGWAAIIPIYNMYIMTKIGGKPGIWVLLFFIPFVNIIFLIWLYNMVSKSFGKDEGFTVGLVLLGIIFWPILGFGSAKYLGPYGDPVAFRLTRNNTNLILRIGRRKKNISMPRTTVFGNFIYEVFSKLTHSFSSFSV